MHDGLTQQMWSDTSGAEADEIYSVKNVHISTHYIVSECMLWRVLHLLYALSLFNV